MKKILNVLFIIALLYVVLLIPVPHKEYELKTPSEISFVWNKDELWKSLEKTFMEAKNKSPNKLDSIVDNLKIKADVLLNEFEGFPREPQDPIFELLERSYFEIAPLIAAQEKKGDWHIRFYNRVRKKVKSDSRYWDMSNESVRNLCYRILYGMRATVEEILLQSNDDEFISTMHVSNEPSMTPSIELLGIKVHSGDLLVSRGGAEVSAFISRGNDYPGNFSHVAIVHIDQQTNKPYFVEAHIEKGVAIATLDEYLGDEKLRFMVMRPRMDLPLILANPMIPYKASTYIFNESQKRHIPYDFKMDYFDSSEMFCSEVGSYAYKQFGIQLWEFESTISSRGIIEWLNVFGVENFVTQMPSDLEYDPTLSIVAEWRNKEKLFQDHLHNAVMDALIGRANNGEKLDYNLWQLPLARLVKGYSLVLNAFGKEGIIPNGMDAVSALKNNDFVARFQNCETATKIKIETFKKTNGYLPPYWQLVRMAEECSNN